MSKIYKYYLVSLLFAPLIGYFTFHYGTAILGKTYFAGSVVPFAVVLVFVPFLFLKIKIVIPKFLYWYIAYVIYIYIWKFYDGHYDQVGLLQYLYSNMHLYSILFIIIAYSSNISNSTYKLLLILIAIYLIVALAGALIQFFVDPMFFIKPEGWGAVHDSIYTDRRPSIFTYVSNNEYTIAVTALFSLYISHYKISSKNIIILIFSLIVGIYAVLTGSRTIMIGFFIVLSQLINPEKFDKKIQYSLYIIAVLLIIYLIVNYYFGYDLEHFFYERLFAEGAISQTSRYRAFYTFSIFFPENPIFGTGEVMTEEIKLFSRTIIGSSQIHVGYLAHLVSYGIFGSIFLFTFWFLLAKDLLKKAKITNYYGPFYGFLMFLWGNATYVSYNLFYPGMMLVFVFSQYYYNNHIQKVNIITS